MPVYTSFVLRVWRVREGRRWTCRAMVERVSNGERVGFADLSSLVAFLQAEADEAAHMVSEADTGRNKGSRAEPKGLDDL